VKFHRKTCEFLLGAGLLTLVAGCSGINMSPSVSPATFLLPGLLKADPPPQAEPPVEKPLPSPTSPATPEQETATQVALAR
jgi:hypothetical protein